jgi:hypothetical protein
MKFGLFRKDEITLGEIFRIKENEAEVKNKNKIGIGIQKTITAAKKPLTFGEWRAFIHYQLQMSLIKLK